MQDNHNNGDTFVSNKTLEIVTAFIILVFGAIVMWDSNRIGAGWGADGPESGSFPFYVGLLIVISAIITAFNAIRENDQGEFVGKDEFKLVLAVLLPAIVYVIALGYIGIYVASIIFIAVFMVWQGKFSVLKSLIVAVLVNLFFLVMFEIAFKIPLPKTALDEKFVAYLTQLAQSLGLGG